ncbi:mannitol-1-phosphate 5-dehydrogenase [Lentinus tigrinus ALCF2SS1-7]|uniref:Mannitol-1-phosphate 5-dehydrogenase n=1 Tax=Lentinus tigrinus ALCF2SS1-6 TaxID=1328759 RepID=A0A5C2SG65_9APHY|nr:mannitol-1-phosphate 5-dehydrogenase [Lentinus tigrinus ALCF2SS1-6]RPD77475.1 mannitol-1-phosphate 5-dehydrogenase [Lentinus tigrinus ALCF2SS1-7]
MPNTSQKAIHFGAGNIGRGFIGPLLVESGYHVIFADVNEEVIRQLNKQVSYDVLILDEDDEYRNSISDVSGVVSTSDDIIKSFADPELDIITTAVGPAILEKIAVTIAKGLHARREAKQGSLNIIACENMINQTTALRKHVFDHLSDDDKAWVEENVGFANCSVDRIVPPCDPKDSDRPLDVGVEGFYEWVVDQGALQRTPPRVHLKGVKLTTDLDAYIERKLFTLNCGHAISAYLGFLKGHTTTDQAVRDPEVRAVVYGALWEEAGAALIFKHKFDEGEYRQYVEKIMERFGNPRMKDEVTRVGRDPLRKLAKGDRLLGPTEMALVYGLPTDNLSKGIAAAFLFDYKEDKQAVDLQKRVEKEGIEKVVADITGFEQGSKEHGKILEAYKELRKKYKLKK